MPTKAGRPRSVERDRALLLATQDLLAEVGYDRLSIDAVASRCGAGKTTIYRRWSGKSELVADAVALLHGDYPHPDTGTLRGDLVSMASTWLAADARRDAVVAGLLTAMAHDENLREAVRVAVAEPHQEVFAGIVERARARGEVASELDLEVIGAVFPAVTFHYLTVLAAPMGKALVERIIDSVLLPALSWQAP